jgi:hypothetical protein
MDGAVVGSDDEVAVGQLGIFERPGQEFEGDPFENEIVSGLEIVIGQGGENGARFSDVGIRT